MNALEMTCALMADAGIPAGHAARIVADAERARHRDERLSDAARRILRAEAVAHADLAASLAAFAAQLDSLDAATWSAAA